MDSLNPPGDQTHLREHKRRAEEDDHTLLSHCFNRRSWSNSVTVVGFHGYLVLTTFAHDLETNRCSELAHKDLPYCQQGWTLETNMDVHTVSPGWPQKGAVYTEEDHDWTDDHNDHSCS